MLVLRVRGLLAVELEQAVRLWVLAAFVGPSQLQVQRPSRAQERIVAGQSGERQPPHGRLQEQHPPKS